MRVGSRRGGRARVTDRVEDVAAWLLALLAVTVVCLAVSIGQLGHDRTLSQDRPEDRVLVDAVVLDTAIAVPGPSGSLVRWTSPTGTTVVGRVPPTARTPGGHVPLWIDRRTGAPTRPPADPVSADVVGWTWGSAVVLGGWSLLTLAWFGLRTLTGRHNDRAWEQGWAHVEPAWSGRV